MTLKPCPFCGSESLKHYVTAASGGGMRGVVVCKSCGARLEAYNDDYRTLVEAGYSFDDAKTYQRGLVSDAVAEKWNKRPELSCALEYDTVRDCFVCDSCGEPLKMPVYAAASGEGYKLLRPFKYCPHCGKKISKG